MPADITLGTLTDALEEAEDCRIAGGSTALSAPLQIARCGVGEINARDVLVASAAAGESLTHPTS
jgi:hypothetical protein